MSSQRWKFSQYMLAHDGTGVISKWFETLSDEVVAEFDARFVQWAADDKWLDLYRGADNLDKHGERFEELNRRREIPITVDGVVYRVLGVHFDVWEFVMLVGYTDTPPRSGVPEEIEKIFQERLRDLQQNPHHRCDYEFD